MAKHVLVTYKVKPERLAEHEALIQAVFAQLAAQKTEGIRYGVFKQPDGLSFVHLGLADGEKSPLADLPAFKAFTEHIKDRIEAPPTTTDLTPFARYEM